MVLPQTLPVLLLKTPLIQPAHLSQILFTLLPGALSILFAALEFILPQAPGLFFAPAPFVALLVRRTPVVVAREAIPVSVAPIVFVALPELALTFVQATLFLGLSPL